MPAPSFTIAQQVAAFAVSVGSAAGIKFRTLEDMQAYVTKLSKINLGDSVIQDYMGSDWITIWPPKVWVNPTQSRFPVLVDRLVVDNTMACYYSPSQNLFVLAIAGTNPASMFDWGQEDLDIKTLVPWTDVSPSSGPSSGNISAGTFNGIKALLGMEHQGVSVVSALATYISSYKISDATIAVAGHSLGGALAPCIGLYLYDNSQLLGSAKQNIAVYAYAGPTPGDQGFADYYEGRIDDSSFTYSSVYNKIDIVPQAWVIESLQAIPKIYDTNISFKDTPNNTFLGVLATNMQLSSLQAGGLNPKKRYTQVSKGLKPFTADFNADVYNNCSTKVAALLAAMPVGHTYMHELGALVNVLYQADAQHTASYFGGTVSLPKPGEPNNTWKSQPVKGYLAIDGYTMEYQNNLTANVPPTATFASNAAIAIKKIMGLDLHDMNALRAMVAPKTAEESTAVA